MTDQDSLMRSILDAPDDDAPRLVYADWLEEHGEAERAEFIRLQIEAERLPEGEPARLNLESRINGLLYRNRKAWLKGLPKWAKEFASTASANSRIFTRVTSYGSCGPYARPWASGFTGTPQPYPSQPDAAVEFGAQRHPSVGKANARPPRFDSNRGEPGVRAKSV